MSESGLECAEYDGGDDRLVIPSLTHFLHFSNIISFGVGDGRVMRYHAKTGRRRKIFGQRRNRLLDDAAENRFLRLWINNGDKYFGNVATAVVRFLLVTAGVTSSAAKYTNEQINWIGTLP